MVIVSLAFIGIVVGALLSAAGYAYKLKMQDLNAKDNFYYVEQAMNEIYAGVGTHTIEQLKEAYNYTIENMVVYDLKLNTYTTISDAEANEMFKQRFMDNIKNSTYFKQGNLVLADSLANYISNETVVMDKGKLVLDVGTDSIVIKNVTLTRTQNYEASGSGTYTQTLSTDIVIGKPNFEVNFNTLTSDYSTIFDFALIADMGVEISQEGNPVNIVGNIYAAADYYNKDYNTSEDDMTFKKTYTVAGTTETVDFEFKHSSVTSKYYKTAINNTYENLYAKDKTGKSTKFDGEELHSMYSGLYIDNTQVAIMADALIVPGSIAVMNSSELSVYGKDRGSLASATEIWADNFVLDGYSRIDEDGKYEGPEAILRANLFVKDDTEINAAGSAFTLKGGYYGYGDSTEKDARVFVPTVDTANFTVPVYDADGNIVTVDDEMVTENRGHYNSSAIIINGQQATLNLQDATEIYLAGRAYIELSKKNTTVEDTAMLASEDGTPEEVDIITQTYSYQPTETVTVSDTAITSYIRDYKTGESISVKSSQLAYIPVSKTSTPIAATAGEIKYIGMELAEEFAGVDFFGEFFPVSVFGDYIPVITQRVSGKMYYYYDFATAYDILVAESATDTNAATMTTEYASADEYATGFIVSYYEKATDKDDETFTTIADYLNEYDDFSVAEINVPTTGKKIYSSGAITTKKNNVFTLVTENDTKVISSLLGDADDYILTAPTDALGLSDDLEMEYNYMKWNLDHYETASLEKQYVKDLVDSADFGESAITPINKYLVMSNISKEINPDNLALASGYKVWISDGTETLEITGDSNIRGMIITKGDVIFGSDVTSFEGLIVAGGKIYIRNKVASITASPEICRSILRECVTSSDELCKDVLKVFTEYKDFKPEDVGNDTTITVDQINYTDVVSLENWMKNVE